MIAKRVKHYYNILLSTKRYEFDYNILLSTKKYKSDYIILLSTKWFKVLTTLNINNNTDIYSGTLMSDNYRRGC